MAAKTAWANDHHRELINSALSFLAALNAQGTATTSGRGILKGGDKLIFSREALEQSIMTVTKNKVKVGSFTRACC